MANHYRLSYRLIEPDEDDEGKYVAEAPQLPGCRAWGESSREAVENLRSVASEFIKSYKDHGDELPNGIDRPN